MRRSFPGVGQWSSRNNSTSIARWSSCQVKESQFLRPINSNGGNKDKLLNLKFSLNYYICFLRWKMLRPDHHDLFVIESWTYLDSCFSSVSQFKLDSKSWSEYFSSASTSSFGFNLFILTLFVGETVLFIVLNIIVTLPGLHYLVLLGQNSLPIVWPWINICLVKQKHKKI